MFRSLSLALGLLVLAQSARAEVITGQYVEARTCEVFTGACFANADTSLTGRHGIMAWKIDKGSLDGVRLDGLGVVAIVSAADTLGQKQVAPAKTVVIVDNRANQAQRDALVRFVQLQADDLIGNVSAIESAAVSLTICDCKDGGCARLEAGSACIETRCINAEHDRACGNDAVYYPPLAKDVKAQAATVVQHSWTGKGLNETWMDSDRRGAYLGSFAVK